MALLFTVRKLTFHKQRAELQRVGRAVVNLYADSELLPGGNRSQRILSRDRCESELCGETIEACSERLSARLSALRAWASFSRRRVSWPCF